MDAQRAARYLLLPWHVQREDMNQVAAAWAAVCRENSWITMEEWSAGEPHYAYCNACHRWCQDDHAASKKCMATLRKAGLKPGYILTTVIQNKHAQRKNYRTKEQDDRGNQHCTQPPLPIPANRYVGVRVPVCPPARSWHVWACASSSSVQIERVMPRQDAPTHIRTENKDRIRCICDPCAIPG